MENRQENELRQELISVIIPIYNVEKYLEQCLNSVLSQTYSLLEIILVDDGTLDQSGVICDSFAERDTRIRVIHKKNGGLSDARNAGIDVATGEWIVFVDADDFIHPQMIELLYRSVLKSNSQLAWCKIKEVPEDGCIADLQCSPEHYWAPEKIDICVYEKQEAERQFYTVAGMQECMVTWNKIYQRQLFKATDGLIRFPKGKIYEDGYTTYRLIYQAKTIAVISSALYYYRQRSGSIMNRNSHRTYEAALESGMERMDFYQNKKEKELYRLELNLTIYSVIRFYEHNESKQDKQKLKMWYRLLYYDYFVKEKWPLAKRIRMKSFLIGYPCYRFISSFEKVYNKLTGKSW